MLQSACGPGSGAASAAGEMSVGELIMVQLYINQLFRPLSNLGGETPPHLDRRRMDPVRH